MKTRCILILIVLLLSCNYNPCEDSQISCAGTDIYIYGYYDAPKSIELYTYSQNSGFTKPETEENRDRETPNIQQEYGFMGLSFTTPFMKDKDYRLVIDDTVFFDINHIVYNVLVDSAHRSMGIGGFNKACVIYWAEVNGKPLDKKYLYTACSIELPYSIRKIVHKK